MEANEGEEGGRWKALPGAFKPSPALLTRHTWTLADQLGCEIHEIEKGLRAVYWWGRYTLYILWALVAYARLDATRQGKVMLESSNLGWIT